MCILKLKLTEILNTFNTFFFTKHLTLMNEIRAENRTIPLKNKSKIFIYKKKENNCNQQHTFTINTKIGFAMSGFGRINPVLSKQKPHFFLHLSCFLPVTQEVKVRTRIYAKLHHGMTQRNIVNTEKVDYCGLLKTSTMQASYMSNPSRMISKSVCTTSRLQSVLRHLRLVTVSWLRYSS